MRTAFFVPGLACTEAGSSSSSTDLQPPHAIGGAGRRGASAVAAATAALAHQTQPGRVLQEGLVELGFARVRGRVDPDIVTLRGEREREREREDGLWPHCSGEGSVCSCLDAHLVGLLVFLQLLLSSYL